MLQKKGIELGKLAVYYSLNQEAVDTTLVGMNNRHLLACNLEAVKGISAAEADALVEVMR